MQSEDTSISLWMRLCALNVEIRAVALCVLRSRLLRHKDGLRTTETTRNFPLCIWSARRGAWDPGVVSMFLAEDGRLSVYEGIQC